MNVETYAHNGDERDMFVGLGWEKEIRSLENFHVLFNLSLEYDIGVVNQHSNDYKMTSFLQFTQT